MKTKKNALLLSLIFLRVLPFGYGIEPWKVIERFLSIGVDAKKTGNVLSYQNADGEIIVLRSGSMTSESGDWESGCINVSIDELISLVTGIDGKVWRIEDKKLCSDTEDLIITEKMFNAFCDVCMKNNERWSNFVAIRHYRDLWKKEKVVLHLNSDRLLPKFKSGGNIHALLGQYRHTEIQVQALFNAWKKARTMAGQEQRACVLRALLPKILVFNEEGKPVSDSSEENRIYSLFEACHACEKTAWLQIHKNLFCFKILDKQYTVEDGNRCLCRCDFMSQAALEELDFPETTNFLIGDTPVVIIPHPYFILDFELLGIPDETKMEVPDASPMTRREFLTWFLEEYNNFPMKISIKFSELFRKNKRLKFVAGMVNVFGGGLATEVQKSFTKGPFCVSPIKRPFVLKEPFISIKDLIANNYKIRDFPILGALFEQSDNNLRKINSQIDRLGYRIQDVQPDGNCGFYAILQCRNPGKNYEHVTQGDNNWVEAQTLRETMFPNDSLPLHHMVTQNLHINEREEHYLPLDIPEVRLAIYNEAHKNNRQVIVINTTYNPNISSEINPVNHMFMIINGAGGVDPYDDFARALASAGGNPMILLYTPGHWQAVMKKQ